MGLFFLTYFGFMKAKCAYCCNMFEIYTGHYNRAMSLGLNVYCNRTCSGLGRRTNETPEEKKVYKQWYDLFIRESMTDEEKAIKMMNAAILFQLDYRANPDKYKKERQRKMPMHVEYCRNPEYKKWKKGYDEQYRAKKDYGEYWEAAIALKNLDKEIDYRESKRQNKLYNKSTTKRKRKWQKQLKQNIKNLQRLI